MEAEMIRVWKGKRAKRRKEREKRQDAFVHRFKPGDTHEYSSFLSHSLTKRRQKSKMFAVTEK